jgi:predicted flap endonuclease-1-like 5' DNA nuclease
MDWLIVLIFVIVVILVWIFLLINANQDKPDIEADIHPSTHGAAHADELPAHASVALAFAESETSVEFEQEQQLADRAVTLDLVVEDLTKIEGIGPKVNRVLHDNGISSFKDLANTKISDLRQILDKAGFQYMDPGTWPQQAKLIAENRLQEFEDLIGNLKGGRRAS